MNYLKKRDINSSALLMSRYFIESTCFRLRKLPYIFFMTFYLISMPFMAHAQEMINYTAYPPFIPSDKPNLLLMFDNSGSMWDLAYIDNGNPPVRQSSYCYDNTYISSNSYGGYFVDESIYEYNFTNARFEEVGSFPLSCSHQFAGQLCVNIVAGPPKTVNKFIAKGNYLNWLSASKFDVKKQILTGGKYNASKNEYIAETRGCVGRRFVKEALTADYVEGGINTSLGVTLSIKGPVDSVNPTAPSPGGQTYIQVFSGDYNQQVCQTAIDTVIDSNNPSAVRRAVSDCLSYTDTGGAMYCTLDVAKTCTMDSDCLVLNTAGTCTSKKCSAPASMVGQSCKFDSDCNTYDNYGPCSGASHSTETNTKISFNQSMQECWQIWSGAKTKPGHDAYSGESKKCEEIYAGYKACNGGTNDGYQCTSDSECPGGGACMGGPTALRPGNPALLCSSSYAGYCATSSNKWVTTTWAKQEYNNAEDCFISKYTEYCTELKVPPVIDPSDTPDDTAETANLPAIISEVGVEAQLGKPIAELKANRYDTKIPTGLLNDYANSIRFGVMTFHKFGSKYECGLSSTDSLGCPNTCNITTDKVCSTNSDCPEGEKCSTFTGDKDGSYIKWYIGEGKCSATTGQSCVRNDQCPSSEKCIAIIGDHDSGLIQAVDDLKANAWTPFSEAYYNAIAYFVKDATDNSNLDTSKYKPSSEAITEPLNSGDFIGNKNPIESSCQNNNILIISDGGSTTDLHEAVKSKVMQASNLFNDGDVSDSTSCGNYMGSSYLDDLSYFAKNRNIFNPTDNDPDDDDIAQRITTHVVYTGTQNSTLTGECEPMTLMENTAKNGGTSIWLPNPKDSEDLKLRLQSAFNSVAGQSSAGTSVSVLSTTGEGHGAVYQAYFYPLKEDKSGSKELRAWIGHLNAFFIDKYGNLREARTQEDTDRASLDLKKDYIIEIVYEPNVGTKIYRYSDDNGDGMRDGLIGVVDIDDANGIWKGGKKLWETNPSDRLIYTTTTSDGNGSVFRSFTAANADSLKSWLRPSGATDAEKSADALNIIKWTRGDAVSGFRKRSLTLQKDNGPMEANEWKLGDIVYSTPTTVGRPMENYDLLYGDGTYSNFRKAHLNRRHVVYVGSNDGMLHAFNGGCFDANNYVYKASCSDGDVSLGQELWAFIPRGLLPHLKWLTSSYYTHVYYVDLKPKITDVNIFTSDSSHVDGWGTVLIGGFRYGGKTITCGDDCSASPEYFAIDITKPREPRLLWTFTDPELGLSMSYPSIARVDDKWYVIFGSGATDYNIESDLTDFQEGNVFALDISSGTNGVISSWTEGVNYWKLSTGNDSTFMSDPITVDVDIDSDVDVAYIGENYKDGSSWNAKMLRITTDKGTDNNPGQWQMSTLADIDTIAGSNDVSKRITSAPSAAMDDRANLYVFFGTGQFLGKNDKNTSDSGAFYGIKDGCWGGSCTSEYTKLLDISKASVNNADGSVSGISPSCSSNTPTTWANLQLAASECEGWAMYFKNVAETQDFNSETLTHTGERVIGKPLVLGGLVAWTTYVPSIYNCSLGESNVYAVYYKTGTAYKKYVFDEQKKQTNPSDTVARVKKLGPGMPSTMSAQVTESGNVKGFVQQSTGSILELENITPLTLKSGVLGWKPEEIP